MMNQWFIIPEKGGRNGIQSRGRRRGVELKKQSYSKSEREGHS